MGRGRHQRAAPGSLQAGRRLPAGQVVNDAFVRARDRTSRGGPVVLVEGSAGRAQSGGGGAPRHRHAGGGRSFLCPEAAHRRSRGRSRPLPGGRRMRHGVGHGAIRGPGASPLRSDLPWTRARGRVGPIRQARRGDSAPRQQAKVAGRTSLRGSPSPPTRAGDDAIAAQATRGDPQAAEKAPGRSRGRDEAGDDLDDPGRPCAWRLEGAAGG